MRASRQQSARPRSYPRGGLSERRTAALLHPVSGLKGRDGRVGIARRESAEVGPVRPLTRIFGLCVRRSCRGATV